MYRKTLENIITIHPAKVLYCEETIEKDDAMMRQFDGNSPLTNPTGYWTSFFLSLKWIYEGGGRKACIDIAYIQFA